MKLNLLKCVKAFDAIAEIENLDTDFSTAHALVMAKKELEPHVQFFSEKELELAKLYGKRGENGALILDGNRFQIAPESREIYRKKRNGLNLVMVDVTRRTITPPVNVKPSVLEALMEIFDFKEDKP